MKLFNLLGMTRGWFVGDFEPVAHRTSLFEVGIKKYSAGDVESIHHHRVSKEITVVLSGRVRMCGQEFGPNDIILLDECEATGFEAITEVVTVVVKFPSVPGDKHDGLA